MGNLIRGLRYVNAYIYEKMRRYGFKYRTYEESINYLNTFPEPQNDIDRSFYQFKCVIYVNDIWILHLLKNIVAFFVLIIFLLREKVTRHMLSENHHRCVCVIDGERVDMIPSSLTEDMVHEKIGREYLLKVSDYNFIWEIWKSYPLSFLFLLRQVLKIANYRAIIEKYHPEKIICSCEYSDTSSILTFFCEKNGIEHINVKHGEMGKHILWAFCRFTKFYVWDKTDIESLMYVRCGTENFVVETPPCLKMSLTKPIRYDYKYYLQLETENTMQALQEVIRKIHERGKTIILRPHPLHVDSKLFYKYISRDLLENPASVNIDDSVSETEYVISRASTVLYQAYLNGKKIIIDDVTDMELYEKLCHAEFHMLYKPHQLLSEVLK